MASSSTPTNSIGTNQYIGSYYFRVTVKGNDSTDGFIRVSPVIARTETVDFKHGFDKNVRKIAGRTTYEPITLERVYQGTDEFRAWREEIERGSIRREDVTIEYCAPDGTAVRTLLLGAAYPSGWEMPGMDSGNSQPAVEKITFAVESVTMVTGTPYSDPSDSTGGGSSS